MNENEHLPALPRLDAADVDRRYEQARDYFRQSLAAAVRVNAALVACLGVYFVRLVRLTWEALQGVWARLRIR